MALGVDNIPNSACAARTHSFRICCHFLVLGPKEETEILPMSNPVLTVWEMYDVRGGPYSVLPDGCCDLVWKHSVSDRPEWLVTQLQSRTVHRVAAQNTQYRAIRFKPGVKINRMALLNDLQRHEGFDNHVLDSIAEYAHLDDDLEATLKNLSSGQTVAKVAKNIGVSTRTLQRYVVRETGQTPVFWTMLARVRRAARALSEPLPLSDTAFIHGFADQAHMTRDFARWFGVSPKQMQQSPTLQTQVSATGFG